MWRINKNKRLRIFSNWLDNQKWDKDFFNEFGPSCIPKLEVEWKD